MATALMSLFASLFLLFARGIARWFVEAPELRELTASLLVIAAFFQVADGVQVMSSNALRGMRDVRIPAVIAVYCYWGVQVPLAATLAFGFDLGAASVWWTLVAGLTLAAIGLTARFVRLSLRLKPEPATSHRPPV